jgi:hypothetical protein
MGLVAMAGGGGSYFRWSSVTQAIRGTAILTWQRLIWKGGIQPVGVGGFHEPSLDVTLTSSPNLLIFHQLKPAYMPRLTTREAGRCCLASAQVKEEDIW